MANVTLYKQDGSENGKVELNDAIWAVEPNENVVFDAVVMQRASLRQGTHAVKNRSAVSGGGRKPFALLVLSADRTVHRRDAGHQGIRSGSIRRHRLHSGRDDRRHPARRD